MKLLSGFLMLLCTASFAFAEPKPNAGADGLEEAQKDVVALKLTLKQKSPDELINEFIPSGPKRFGGYEYYYKYMANIAVRSELESRGKSAESALRANATNPTQIWEAINGPGESVGGICTQLLAKLPK